MTTWRELLDDYAERIAALERSLERDQFEGAPGAFTPPPAPALAPTRDERAEFDRCRQRADRVAARLSAALAASEAEMGVNRRRATAARAYHRNG